MEPVDRFAFGQNWQSFLKRFAPARLEEAKTSLRRLLARERLDGLTFLDVGSGSGLFSAAALALGAEVLSFDFDSNSVAATQSLRPEEAGNRWIVTQGSILDAKLVDRLGMFDVVYCWGVAHHTGSMWDALHLLSGLVRPAGTLVVALYNDQGLESRIWSWIKRSYNARPWLRPFLLTYGWLRLWGWKSLVDLARLRPFYQWRTNCGDHRGMTAWHDLVDWVGGYPFEVATPDEVLAFFRARSFNLERLHTRAGGHGCNEFVFAKGERS
ncbi:MAG TPA: class I SAM-dependent methyltransferase [Xanthomonadaceae bacterium]|nr:class I SAM-dependent methyltransferase [Xanthomonadaceae bacterium]